MYFSISFHFLPTTFYCCVILIKNNKDFTDTEAIIRSLMISFIDSGSIFGVDKNAITGFQHQHSCFIIWTQCRMSDNIWTC